jgi:hypothetical protein
VCGQGQPQLLNEPILQSLVCSVISTALDHLPIRCQTRVKKLGCRPASIFEAGLGCLSSPGAGNAADDSRQLISTASRTAPTAPRRPHSRRAAFFLGIPNVDFRLPQMGFRYMVRSRFDWLFIPTLAGLIGLYLAIFVYYVFATVITVPYLDLLEWILRYDEYWRAGDWWHYLWLPHNGHRLVWSLLLVLADIECCRGSTLPFFLFDSACFLLTVGGPVWAIWVADLAIELKAILATAVILLLAASWAVIYCSLPIEGVFVHATGLFVLALVLLDGVGDERCGATIRRAAAILAAVLAAFGVAGGLFAPVVLLWAAWAGGLGRAWLIAISLTAGILFAVYLPGIPTDQVDHLLDRTALPKLADYYVRLLGLPWSHTTSLVWFGRLVGCIVFGASTVTLFGRGILRRSVGRLERMGVALLMFSLLITAMVAVGRWNWGPERPVSIRYGIFAALAEAGLLLANTPWLNWLWQKGHRRPFQWATLAAATVFLVQQVAAGQAAVVVTLQYKNGYREFVAGQGTGAPARPVFLGSAAERERVLRIIPTLGIYQN